MARLFLHIHNRIGFVRDDEGEEFENFADARAKAFDGIRSIVSDEARSGRIDLNGAIHIADADGRELEVLGFAEAFDFPPPTTG